tara:strand:+ start:43456 stop:44343 length:888 start_codon:yes stop_codon:yes gene_type:complete
VSKIRLIKGKSLNIPISLDTRFDITGQEDLIEKFSDDVLQDIINPVKDYEVSKFIHDYDSSGDNGLYIAASFIDSTNNEQFWIDEYYPQGFDKGELVLFSKAVKNSFFKLDFFDTTSRERQKLQLTKIIPMYLSNYAMFDIDKDGIPDYEDDMVDVDGDGIDDNTAGNDDFGDRFESSRLLKPTQTGTYIVPNLYSNNVKNNEISDLFVFKSLSTKPFNEFYMSCRFFNAKTGDVVRMTNDPLIDSGINPKKDFYYKVKLNRQKLTYEIYDYSDGVEGDRVGDSDDNPLMFYQML